ncbi:MAG TPA: zinc-binding dehydrogenase [Burkholderiales bacterium]|nr:zinc-binding dehydrogenase [Burkholderiales bacterium]
MKSCWIKTDHDKAVLEFRDVPVPQPAPGQLVVRVYASALNRGELIVGGVVHGGPEKIGGNEVSGLVHAVAEGVTGIAVGARVFGRARGGFAEYALMEAHQAMPIPARLSWEQAAAIPVSFLTAYEMLYPYGGLRRGDWLLATAASSGAGVASIQIARMLGAHTIGTSGSAEKLARLSAIGLEHGIATRGGDFASRVKELSGGKGVDLVVNCVGGSVFGECMRALAYKGRIATVGYVDGVLKSEIDLGALHANRYVVFGVSNARLSAEGRAGAVSDFARDVLPAIADGRITPLIDKVYAFDALPEAKARMESNAQVGKIVVRIA